MLLSTAGHRHETEECPERTVVCPRRCGVQAIKAKLLSEHDALHCPERIVQCKLGCGVSGLRARNVDRHMFECPNQAVSCPFGCDVEGLLKCNVNEHKRVCSRRLVECPNQCRSGQVPANELDAHLLECDMRSVRSCHCLRLRLCQLPLSVSDSPCSYRQVWSHDDKQTCCNTWHSRIRVLSWCLSQQQSGSALAACSSGALTRWLVHLAAMRIWWQRMSRST